MSPLSATDIRPAAVRRAPNAAATAAVLVLLLVMLGAGRLVQAPHFVGQVNLVNRTPFDLNVQVDNGHPGDSLALGVAQPDQTTAVNQVVDQGDTWVFSYSRGGVTAGTIRMTQSELEARHWQVVIPASADVPLLAAGQQPAG